MESQLEKIAYVYGDVCVRRKKQRRKRQKLLVIDLLFDYAKNSSLHGLRYIVARGLSIAEKLFWFTTFVASIGLCSYCIYETFEKWRTSPVIVTVNGRLASVGTVPFPAVTICPRIKVKQKVYNYTQAFELYLNESLSGADLETFTHIDSMCDFSNSAGEGGNFTDLSLVNRITEVAQTSYDIFYVCSWHNTDENCRSLFSRVYTQEGVCYTANSLAARDIFENNIQSEYQYLESNSPMHGWSIDKGYNYSETQFYPRRGRVLGSKPDMEIVLKHNPDFRDDLCNGLYSGYKIYLQHPADFPQSSLYYYAALPDQITSLAINFHEFNTDKSLTNYRSDVRQCYFQEHRKLRYFKIYTAKNCQAECLSNYTYQMCKCVGFYMPHDNSTQICAPIKQTCLDEAKDFMAKNELRAELGLQGGCLCLPACDTIEYDAEILKTEYKLQNIIKKYVFNDTHNISYSLLELFFKKPQFVTMQRRELFGVTDLLANIGGLLGVFLGFSFLSLVEIFYFLTLRVGFTLKRDLEEEKRNKKSKIGGTVAN